MQTMLPLIQQLEAQYDTLANVPDDNPTLMKIREYAWVEHKPIFNGRKDAWTKKEIDYLELNYPFEPTKRVAKILGRSVSSVAKKAHHLKLRKDDMSFANRNLKDIQEKLDELNRHVVDFQVDKTIIRERLGWSKTKAKRYTQGCFQTDWSEIEKYEMLMWELIREGHSKKRYISKSKAQRFKRARSLTELSEKAMAKLSGVGLHTIKNIERGDWHVNREDVKRYAEYLGLKE